MNCVSDNLDLASRLAALGVPGEVVLGIVGGQRLDVFFDRPDPGSIAEYFANGEARGEWPGPYFDPEFYKQQNPDWRDGGTALGHFLRQYLHGDHREAHPLFDREFYALLYPDLVAAGMANLHHFALHGDAERRLPSRDFDPHFYARAYMPLEDSRPLAHFCSEGRRLGHLPRPIRHYGDALPSKLAELVGMRRKPVILIGHDARRAGAPILLLDVARRLVARGWEPIILLLEGGPLLASYRALGPVFLLAEGWRMGRPLEVKAPVLANTIVSTRVLLQMGQTPRPALNLVHEMPAYWAERHLTGTLREAGESGVRMIFSVEAMRAAYLEMGGQETHLHLLRPGLIAPAASLSTHRRITRHLRKAHSRPVLIGAGHADHRKGFDRFLAIARRMTTEGTQAHFVWLGAADATVEAQATACRSEGVSLEMPGFVDDPAAWYRASDLFLLTSRQDVGPTVLFDAVAQGLGFVGYEGDLGLREAAAPFGTFVPADDCEAFLAAVRAALILETPPTRRARRMLLRGKADPETYVTMVETLLQHKLT